MWIGIPTYCKPCWDQLKKQEEELSKSVFEETGMKPEYFRWGRDSESGKIVAMTPVFNFGNQTLS
jgi:hypothetical protein